METRRVADRKSRARTSGKGTWWLIRRGYSSAIEQSKTRPVIPAEEGRPDVLIMGPFETEEDARERQKATTAKSVAAMDDGNVR